MDNDLKTLQAAHRETYDELAPEYAERIETLRSTAEGCVTTLFKVINALPEKEFKTVLDVGCGAGPTVEMLIERGLTVDALDVSSEMLKMLYNRIHKTNPKLLDNLSLVNEPYETWKPTKKYDVIISLAFIHLYPKKDVKIILEKMASELSPGGLIYTGTTKSSASKEGWQLKEDYADKKPRWRSHYTQEEFADLLKEVGLKVNDLTLHDDPFNKTWMDFIVSKS